jgi:Rrf2 family protein
LYLCTAKKLTMFNKETEYALRGLVYIQLQNINGRRPGIAEIAREIEAPHFFTAKILQRMVKHGFIQSLKGKGGGFYFEEDKNELPISVVVSVTEGNKLLSDCGFGLKHCDTNNPCPLHEQYAPIREAIKNLVSNETILSLAKHYRSKPKVVV